MPLLPSTVLTKYHVHRMRWQQMNQNHPFNWENNAEHWGNSLKHCRTCEFWGFPRPTLLELSCQSRIIWKVTVPVQAMALSFQRVNAWWQSSPHDPWQSHQAHLSNSGAENTGEHTQSRQRSFTAVVKCHKWPFHIFPIQSELWPNCVQPCVLSCPRAVRGPPLPWPLFGYKPSFEAGWPGGRLMNFNKG